MKNAARISVLALLVALAATASAGLSIPSQHPCGASASVNDPEPLDCPFCGGNPATHVKTLVGLERLNMAVFATLAR
jgi:hypothetical protein